MIVYFVAVFCIGVVVGWIYLLAAQSVYEVYA